MEYPFFATPQEYGSRFTDADYWRPFVEAICALHGLGPCDHIRAGLPGTNPVFLVEDCWVVKLYTHFFNGAEGYPIELDVYALVAQAPGLPAPALIAHGELFPEGDGWRWPYIVTTLIAGASLTEVYEQVAFEDQVALARSLGPLARRLHALPLEQTRYLRPAWEPFVAFLEAQRAACAANHARWGSLPAHLIDQIDAYVPPIESLVDRGDAPCLLHCDLNADHVLGFFEDGRWRLRGIIDFGDAKVGDRIYELVALHLGLFRYDKHLLRTFLESYGVDPGLRQRFALRAMSMTLLHEFNVLHGVCELLPDAREVTTLEELAALIWEMEGDASIGVQVSRPC